MGPLALKFILRLDHGPNVFKNYMRRFHSYMLAYICLYNNTLRISFGIPRQNVKIVTPLNGRILNKQIKQL
jgi:hypothetical protein